MARWLPGAARRLSILASIAYRAALLFSLLHVACVCSPVTQPRNVDAGTRALDAGTRADDPPGTQDTCTQPMPRADEREQAGGDPRALVRVGDLLYATVG